VLLSLFFLLFLFLFLLTVSPELACNLYLQLCVFNLSNKSWKCLNDKVTVVYVHLTVVVILVVVVVVKLLPTTTIDKFLWVFVLWKFEIINYVSVSFRSVWFCFVFIFRLVSFLTKFSMLRKQVSSVSLEGSKACPIPGTC